MSDNAATSTPSRFPARRYHRPSSALVRLERNCGSIRFGVQGIEGLGFETNRRSSMVRMVLVLAKVDG